ncbi:MAG: formylglycine-generating enzyme family protein [Lewinellaceae bacterium]|nr:formylglycine-generating enzyme family protein [Lewinellaceae bacterium]
MARAFMEVAYWDAETGQLDSARILTSAAARLLSRTDLATSAAKSSDRVALRSVLAGLDNDHFAFLEARYFPDLVRIPGGDFMMGSPDSIGVRSEHPQHRVYLSAFQLAKTETTFWQFAVYTENNQLDIRTFAPQWDIGGDHPVVNVSWFDAARYANWLSAREGCKPAYIFDGERFQIIDYDATGYRLPTEAQWEYAARSGGKNEMYAGFSETADLYMYANSDESPKDGYKYTAPTGH